MLACLPMQQLCITRGQALDIRIEVTDVAGDPVMLSGATLKAGISRTPGSAYLVTGDISIDGSVMIVSLTPEDTASLSVLAHYFSAWVGFGQDDTPVAKAWVIVQDDPKNQEES